MLHCTTARDPWIEARNLSSAVIKSRVMVLKSELHKTRKTLKMIEYLSKMRTIFDQQTLASAPITIEDLILHTLDESVDQK